MTITWCTYHLMRFNDPQHKIDGHICNLIEKEIHVA